MKRRFLLVLAIVVAASPMTLIGVAQGADANAIAVTSVDSRVKDDTKVRVSIDDDATSKKYTFALSENGDDRSVKQALEINSSIANGTTTRRTVVIVDSSITLSRDNRFEGEKQAAKQFIDRMPGGEGDQVMLIGAGASLSQAGGFTTNKDVLKSKIDSFNLSSGRTINSAVNMAIDHLAAAGADVKSIVLFAAGPATDEGTVATAALAKRISTFNVGVYVAGIGIDNVDDASSNKALIQGNRGAYRSVTAEEPASKVSGMIAGAFENQFLVSYRSGAKGVIQLKVSAAGKSTLVATNLGVKSEGEDLKAELIKTNSWLNKLPTLSPTIARLIVSFSVLVAVLLFAWVLVQIFDRRGSLEIALRPYSDRKIDPDEESDLHVETALMRRALEVTEDIARERGFLAKIEDKLYQADLAFNAAEFIFFSFITVLIAAIGAFVMRGVGGGIAVLLLGGLGIPAFLSFKANSRKRNFEKQLPGSLQLLGGSLRAGYSLLQGLDATAQQVDDPLGKELRQALAEARLGRPLEEALSDLANRVQSVDFAWTVMAIRIQRDVGGNLAEVLDNVAKTMVERERLRREINALTAEGKLSAFILAVMPPGLGVYFWLSNPDYINVLFTDSLGKMMLAAGTVGMGIGIAWMKSMLKLDL